MTETPEHLNIFIVEEMINKHMVPKMLRELSHSGIHVRAEQFDILFRPSEIASRIQGGNPVRIIIGQMPQSMNTNDYWHFLKQQIAQVPKFYRSVALVRSGMMVEIEGKLRKSVKTLTGVDINDIPLTLKSHEYEISEMYVVKVKHKKTGCEISLASGIDKSISTREKAILQLSAEVHKNNLMEEESLLWLQKLG